ncbi:serine--tRNA ligase [Candidatus Saccharibacteria bacterium]|nr:serine--tRNA ligase [Candidatus Saccharibacteria bacterium]
MLDIEFIRNNPEAVKKFTKDKGLTADVDQVLKLDSRRRELSQVLDTLREERNRLAKSGKTDKPTPEEITRGKELKVEISATEDELEEIETSFIKLLKEVPNAPLPDVPVGHTEEENKVIETIGEPTKFAFTPKNHYQIAEARGWIDKERGAKVAGSRFAYLKGDLVRLQFAIVQWVMDTLTSETTLTEIIKHAGLKGVSPRPFIPILPPYMIKTDLFDAMDRLEPRDQRYQIEGDELWLQGSAEHVLGSMYSGEILDEKDFPLRLLGYATSFRREAGTYGKDMEGIFRVHQFDKLEMESFTTAEDGQKEHELMVAIQKHLLSELEIPYRVLQKCTFDIGKPNASGFDMDSWLPGQGKYRETHTADYMTDYQARRLKTRVRRKNGDVELIHTNDATAFALGRIMIAIIENYQTEDLRVRIPKVLRPYLPGETL